jgi:hypothetical protein
MFRLKLATIAAALLIGLMNVVPTFASNTVSITDYRLAPGATYCLTVLTATTSADAQGTANAGGADFVVYNGAVKADKSVFTVYGSPGFHAPFSVSNPQGATFPGKFKLCATNPSATNNTRITMSLTTS